MSKRKKYRFNYKRFFRTIFSMIFILIFFFSIYKGFIFFKNKQTTEEYYVNSLKMSIKKAGSENSYNIASEFIEKYPGSELLGYAYFSRGKYFYERMMYEKSLQEFQKASKYSLDTDIKILLQLHLSYAYMCLNDITSSMEYSLKVYDLLEKGKLKAFAAFQTGLCMSAFKMYEKAIYYFEKVIEYSPDEDLIKQAKLEKLKILKKVDLKKA
ncbi:MAG: hypothetical protein C0601_11565 [Candidatus Muiribacterium halophilum]|uniref:Uncharacterized protein n=1 Tax=Muiribacterium halophilum TaxID=2053465 RepID=A0A2N5ZBD3_MUIH1|nr:MAG: hypothetical protein C0601_11565 [Candidatus Muirbacterium halophilum]